MSQEDSENAKNLKSINIHEGRLRMLIQNLREKEAVIRIDYDPNGNPKTTKYSAKKAIKNSLKDLFITFWPEATDSAYYEYLKTDFTTHRKSTDKSKYHPSYEKFIKVLLPFSPSTLRIRWPGPSSDIAGRISCMTFWSQGTSHGH